MFCLSYFALNKHTINTVTCFFLSSFELHPINSFTGDSVFHFISLVNRNLANFQTGFQLLEAPHASPLKCLGLKTSNKLLMKPVD